MLSKLANDMLMGRGTSSINLYQSGPITGTERKHRTISSIERGIGKVHARIKGQGDGSIEVKVSHKACMSHQRV